MGSDVGTDRASDIDAIVGAGMWQVHLGRAGGKLMTKSELEAAVANNELGLETLVREPGAFSWTTAGAATGRSAAPETPPEPERDISSANAIPLSTDDSDVNLASGDLPGDEADEGAADERSALPSEAPVTKDAPCEDSQPALTQEEARVTKPQPLGKSLAILAGLAFLGGVVVVAAPSRAQKASALAKPPAAVAPTTPTAAAAQGTPTPVVKPQEEGPLVVFVVPENSSPTKPLTKPASKIPAPATKTAQATTARTTRPKTTPKKGATASLPPVKHAPSPSKAVAVSGHAQPNRAVAHPVAPPKPPASSAKAAPPKPAPAKPAPAKAVPARSKPTPTPVVKPAAPPAKRH